MSTVPSAEGPADKRFSGHAASSNQTTPSELGFRYPAGVSRYLKYPNVAAWELLSDASERVPNRPAANFLGHEFTYREVDDAATRLASWLQSQGVLAGKRVGVLLPNCPEYLIALSAIWRAGGVAVAISPLSVAADVKRLLDLTDCRTVISLDLLSSLVQREDVDQRVLVSLRPYLPSVKKALYWAARLKKTGHARFNHDKDTWFWNAVEDSDGSLTPVEVLPAKDPAYILSTGGTTGNPKAVTLSHRNIVANAFQQSNWIGSSGVSAGIGQETMLAVLPFFHSYGMSTMLATGAAIGAKLIMQPRFHTDKVLSAIERHRPTIFHAVPAMIAALNQRLRRRSANLSSLKWVISGGASLPADVAFEFASHSGALVVEGYGLSEASPVTHVGPLDGSNITGTIGLPLPDTFCRIVDMDNPGRDLDRGEIGELLVRGPQVMLGYWQNSRATEAAIQDGWLRTGDLARQTDEGFYEIVDRKKDLIITSGFNVYPADVEQVLRECSDIQDVAIVGVPHPSKGEIVKAFVVLNKGVRWNQSRLERFSTARLAKHRRPKVWEHVKDDLPRNFLGKVIRRELRDNNGDSGCTVSTDAK